MQKIGAGEPRLMKRLVLLCVVLSSFLSFGQRLPELARPVNYELTFAPDFEKNIFAGQETISIVCSGRPRRLY